MILAFTEAYGYANIFAQLRIMVLERRHVSVVKINDNDENKVIEFL